MPFLRTGGILITPNKLTNNQIYFMDCLEGMKLIPNNSIDMILCDLPYGVTDNEWDVILPFDLLWEQYERIIKPDGAIVLTANGNFTKLVINSKTEWYRYKWIWLKNNVTNALNAKNKPMSCYEEVLVFSKGTTATQSNIKMKYYPQGLQELNTELLHTNSLFDSDENAESSNGDEKQTSYTGYPKDTLFFEQDKHRFHPTQKPVALFEYLIKTYTNRGVEKQQKTATKVQCRHCSWGVTRFESDVVSGSKGDIYIYGLKGADT